MADGVDTSGYIKKMTDMGLMGTSAEAITGYMGLIEAEAQKQFPGNSAEASQNRNSYKQKAIIAYIESLGKQYRSIMTSEGQAEALKKQIENIPELKKQIASDALIKTLAAGMTIDQKSYEQWKDRFIKHQDDIISSAIAAKKSPYEAMASVASLGIMFGGIAAMAGQAMGKPEWTEFGTKTMSWGTSLAQVAGDNIIKLDKEGKILRNIDRAPEGWAVRSDYTGWSTPILREIQLMNLDPETEALLSGRVAQVGAAYGDKYSTVAAKNPLNLKAVGTNNFRTFTNWADGWNAARDDLIGKVTGQSAAMGSKKPTLTNIITTWAPPSDNDNPGLIKTQDYIARVAKESGVKADQVLTIADIDKIMPAMAGVEGGPNAVAALRAEGLIAGPAVAAKTPTPADKGKKVSDAGTGSDKVAALGMDQVTALHAAVEPAVKGAKTTVDRVKDHADPAFAKNNPAPRGVDTRDVERHAGLDVTTTNPDDATKKKRTTTVAINDPIHTLVSTGPVRS